MTQILLIFDFSLSAISTKGIGFLKKITPIFTENLSLDFESLKKSFEQSDQKQILYFSEKMLGSALYFGVPMLVECLRNAYNQAKTNHTDIDINNIGLQIELAKKAIEAFLEKEVEQKTEVA